MKNSLSSDFGRFLRFEWVLYRVRHYLIQLTVLKQQIYLLKCKNKTKFGFLKWSVFNKTLETNDVAVKKEKRWEKGVGRQLLPRAPALLLSRPKLGMTVRGSGRPKNAIFGLRVKF